MVGKLVAKANPGRTVPSVSVLSAFSVLHHIIIIENIVMIQQRAVLQTRNHYVL
jgi:hypothetical protein